MELKKIVKKIDRIKELTNIFANKRLLMSKNMNNMEQIEIQKWKTAWIHALTTEVFILIQIILGFALLSVPTLTIINAHLLIGILILITASLTLFRLQDLKKHFLKI